MTFVETSYSILDKIKAEDIRLERRRNVRNARIYVKSNIRVARRCLVNLPRLIQVAAARSLTESLRS